MYWAPSTTMVLYLNQKKTLNRNHRKRGQVDARLVTRDAKPVPRLLLGHRPTDLHTRMLPPLDQRDALALGALDHGVPRHRAVRGHRIAHLCARAKDVAVEDRRVE